MGSEERSVARAMVSERKTKTFATIQLTPFLISQVGTQRGHAITTAAIAATTVAATAIATAVTIAVAVGTAVAVGLATTSSSGRLLASTLSVRPERKQNVPETSSAIRITGAVATTAAIRHIRFFFFWKFVL